MGSNNWLFLFLVLNFLTIEIYAGSVWEEKFLTANKGTWGDPDETTVHSDLSGIDQWSLNTDLCHFSAENDYVKTVSTSGGRFEALDCDGEAVWKSRWISIKNTGKVQCSVTTRETGSSNDPAKKYVHVYYQVDEQTETLFEVNGLNQGNWGESTASQSNITGDSIRIIVRLNSSYAADKVIFDDVSIWSNDSNTSENKLIKNGEILFSEILFDPYSGGDEFIEIYNASEEQILLNHLFIATRDDQKNLKSIKQLSSNKHVINPGNYLLLCDDSAKVLPFYTNTCSENFVLTSQLPALKNDGGCIVLLNDSFDIVDEVYYSPTMHHPMITNSKGVSLERTSFDAQNPEQTNWQSATASTGFATPGCPNSTHEIPTESLAKIEFEPPVFSPNGDGYNDILHLKYSFPGSNFVATIKIFDSHGRFIFNLIDHETIGQEGEWVWTGKTNNDKKVPIGIYVIYIELTDLNGTVKQYKKSCTVTDRFL